VSFLGRSHGYDAYLTAAGPELILDKPEPDAQGNLTQRDALNLQFVGANPTALAYGENQLSSYSNYFIGANNSSSFTDVPNYGSVVYRDVYPGVNIAYQGAAGKNLEYTITAQPGADLSQIQLTINGAQGLSLDGAGNLDIQTPGGTVVMQSPVVMQTAPAGSTITTQSTDASSGSPAASFVLENANTIGL